MESNKKELFVIENVLNNKKMDYDKNSEIKLYNDIIKKMNCFEEFTVEYFDNFNELDVNFSEILKITKRCFKEECYMYLERILGQLLSEDKMRVILIKHNGVLIGYASCQFKSEHVRLKDTKFYDHAIGYMTMCAILPEYHSFGVYRFLNYIRLLYLINEKAERIFVRTQNAKVFMGIQSMLENFKQYGLIDSYELEFTKYEKSLFSGMITENFGVKEIKNIPKEFELINAENGDVGLYLWKIKI